MTTVVKDNMLHIDDLKGKKPHFTKNGNIKLGKTMWVWSTMKGGDDEKRPIKDFENKLCSGTCGDNCKVCTKSCYVNRSYRYESVIKGHAINTVWIKENPTETFNILSEQLERAKEKPQQIRINQSGEIMTSTELLGWIALARKNTNTKFYVYTKNYKIVEEVILESNKNKLPGNLTILISIWHNEGVKEYERLKKYSNIKAFVYDDGELEIKPTTYCMAYNEEGKLNHDITCEKCKKCFNRNNNHKIIGCKSH